MLEGLDVVRNIDGPWALSGLIVFCALIAFAIWVNKISGDSKKLIEKSAQLERAETEKRKIERDGQISELRTKIDFGANELSKRIDSAAAVAAGVGKSLDRHIDDHKEKDGKTQKCIENIDNRLRRIEDNLIERGEFKALQDNVHGIDKTVIKIHTILEERFKAAS